MKRYYVYLLLDPRNFYVPFYVGKGCKNRARFHLWNRPNERNSFKQRKIDNIRKAGYEPTISYWAKNLSHADALKLESELILKFGRANNKTGILTNLTDGGEGTSGWIPDQNWLDKHNERLKRENIKPCEAAVLNSVAKRKGVPLSDNHKQKLSESMKGREFSSETRHKISEAKTNPSSDTRRKMSMAQKDKRIITWFHPIIGQVICCRQDLMQKYPDLNLTSSELGKLIKGKYPTCKGWSIISNPE